jgi:hypothetical protein
MSRWKLTDKEWDALDALRFSSTDVTVFRNAIVILMSGVGRSKASIAKESGCRSAPVDSLRKRYHEPRHAAGRGSRGVLGRRGESASGERAECAGDLSARAGV